MATVTGLSRRALLGAAAAGLIADHAFAQAPFELDELTIAELRKYSSESLVTRYLERIERIDRSGPALRAVIETNPDALEIARAMDKEPSRGPLHGIPVLIKDNIDTADRMMTTAGSLALEGSIALKDSFVAQRLRAAGAVILGKTNLSEWANFRSTHSTSGWSGRGGLTRNPYALDRNTSGSSSGSGAAVAANLCAVAVGSETDGSIVSPAAMNGLVGIKPTVGLIGRSGIIPISINQDTAGPMARTVADAAVLLTVLAGVDPNDPYTKAGDGKRAADYSKFVGPDGLRGARLGVARKFFGQFSHGRGERAAHILFAKGAADADAVKTERCDLVCRLAAQVLVAAALHNAENGLLLTGINILPVRFERTLRPAVRALHRLPLILIWLGRRGAFIEREEDVCAERVLYFNRTLGREAVKRTVVVRGE